MNVWTIARIRLVVVAATFACLMAPDASAQYFGRNKVQYKNLDFQVLKTEHFDIYFYPSAKESVDIAARMAERWHARLQKVLGHELRGRQPLVLYASHPDFEQTNAISGEIGEGTGGVTESIRRRIVLPIGGPLADTDHVIGHELVHAFQFDITTRPDAAPGETGAHRLPLWFIEGMAEYLSIGPVDPHTAMWLRDARARGRPCPTIKDLDNPKYFPYRWGQAFWAYVGGTLGRRRHRRDAVDGAANSGDYEVAIERILGIDSKQLSGAMARSRSATPTAAFSTRPGRRRKSGGSCLKGGGGIGGDLNVGPAISPDGKLDRVPVGAQPCFSIDLFVADAATGKVLRKLTSTATDPHFSSLQFIYSAGAWDATSQRIAIATVTDGRAGARRSSTRERRQGARGPARADRRDLQSDVGARRQRDRVHRDEPRAHRPVGARSRHRRQPRQLTNDPYADLQPAWSPDGRRIAFATDRFSSRPRRARDRRLPARADRSGRAAQSKRLARSRAARTSTRSGRPTARSLYLHLRSRRRVEPVSRRRSTATCTQLTDVATGHQRHHGVEPRAVGGLESRRGGLQRLRRRQVLRRTSSLRPTSSRSKYARSSSAPAGCPAAPSCRRSIERTDSEVVAMLADANFGLPPATQEYEVSDYAGGLQLEAIGQPTIAVGADRFGAAIGGGIGFFFSDMLGNQNLATVFQISTAWRQLQLQEHRGARSSYMNQTNRWNWGLVGGQVPYMSGGVPRELGRDQRRSGVHRGNDHLPPDRPQRGGRRRVSVQPRARLEFQGGVSQIVVRRGHLHRGVST